MKMELMRERPWSSEKRRERESGRENEQTSKKKHKFYLRNCLRLCVWTNALSWAAENVAQSY